MAGDYEEPAGMRRMGEPADDIAARAQVALRCWAIEQAVELGAGTTHGLIADAAEIFAYALNGTVPKEQPT